MATTTTNFGWDIPQSTDLVKDGATAIATLGQDIDTAFVDLKGGTTGQILAKASATDLDYSWITNDVGDITAVTAGTGISGGGTSGAVTVTNSMATAITTAGDLIKGTGSGTFDRLGIGSTGQVLTVSAGAPTWATAAGGSGMTLLSTTNLSGATTTVSSISQSYIDLYLVIENVYPSNDTYPRMTVNADTTLTNYPSALIGTRAGGMANRYDNANLVPYGIDGTSHANQITITIPNYAGTTNKCWYVNSSYYGDDVSPYYVAGSGLVSWFGSAAISSVTFALGGAYTYSGGTVKIYGVK